MIQKFKEKYNIDYDEKLLVSVILEMSRSLDSYITEALNDYKSQEGVQLGSVEREKLREEVYYNFIHEENKSNPSYKYFKDVMKEPKIARIVEEALNYLDTRMSKSKKDEENILGSINSRIHRKDGLEVHKKYLEYLDHVQEEQYQLVILKVHKNQDLQDILDQVRGAYDQLSNYHYLAVVFPNEEDKVWEYISKTAIYAENFYQEKNFPPFNKQKEKQKEVLKSFLFHSDYFDISEEQADDFSERFYDSLSSGYHFTDLFISEDAKQKVLMLQKVKYDSDNVPCPDCFDLKPRGNSYTKVLLKSFECSNPHCISRSKSGRGKRYTYLSAKLAHKKQSPSSLDLLPETIYRQFRRDIYSKDTDMKEVLTRLYTFEGETILIIDQGIGREYKKEYYQGRMLDFVNVLEPEEDKCRISDYKQLKIVDFFEVLKGHLKINPKRKYSEERRINVQNANSTLYLAGVERNSFQYAVTSPPYYNAREYSQWSNMLCYLVDMFANAFHMFESLDEQGVYLYNIGDIVDQDNIYITSMMSKRRQILGMYSILIMEEAGFEARGNIVWDKGEVQSKRNSTADLLPHYVKTINSYEHIFVFAKKNSKVESVDKVVEFPPVIKIGPKKRNRVGHTAPYPEELVEQLNKIVDVREEDIVVDPFLGSGTTAVWSYKNKNKCLGIELSKEYYELCLKRLEEVEADFSGKEEEQGQLSLNLT